MFFTACIHTGYNNKFVDVLWFKYLLLRAFEYQFAVLRAIYNEKARNNKYLPQRTSTNLLLRIILAWFRAKHV
jgi:hypothetical protein